MAKTWEFTFVFVGQGETWEEALKDATDSVPDIGEPTDSKLLDEGVLSDSARLVQNITATGSCV